MTEFGNAIEVRLLQSINALSPIEVTVFGMLIKAKLLQPLKTSFSIDVIELGKTAVLRFEQSSKADSPMNVTEFGIVIDVRPLHSLNAPPAIVVIVFGIDDCLHPKRSVFVDFSISALQLFLESYIGLPLSTIILSKLPQAPKALLPIEVTELGIKIDFSP